MIRYIKEVVHEVGYVVSELDDSRVRDRIRPICCFGWWQYCAIEFRNDCENGIITPNRIEMLIRHYTNQPYTYTERGVLRKQKGWQLL